MIHSYAVFTCADAKSTSEDTAVQRCAVIFHSLFNLSDSRAVQILFCIDKARKRSFTEVALNSLLEEKLAVSAIDFAWEFYSPNKNIYEQCILLCFPIFSSVGQSSALCVLSAVQCVLCALCAKKQKCGFSVPHGFLGSSPYYRLQPTLSSVKLLGYSTAYRQCRKCLSVFVVI